MGTRVGLVLVEFEHFGFLVVEVLTGVGGLILEGFDEAVEAYSEEGAEGGA